MLQMILEKRLADDYTKVERISQKIVLNIIVIYIQVLV